MKREDLIHTTIPLLILGGVAVWLQLHWDAIPERFPVHWNISGRADAWSTRTVRGVYQPLIIGAANAIMMFCIAFALGKNEAIPRPGMRRESERLVYRLSYLLSLLFASIGLGRLYPGFFPPVLIGPVVLIGTGLLLIPVIRAHADPDSEEDQPTPEDAWKFGLIYYNPADSALMVPKRLGIGYTMNFARPLAWLLLSGILLTPVIMLFLLK